MKKTENGYMYMAVCSILCLLLVQRFAAGIKYMPVMDDWFLYGDMCDDIWTQYVIPNQKFSIRPFAGLADIFIVGPMFRSMWVLKLFICLMLVSSAFMLCDVLYKDGFTPRGFMMLMICLFPLNIEATYWMASAIRSVSALFFVSLSAFLIMKYSEYKKKRYMAFYFLTGFFAVGFCEQVIPLYILLSLYLLSRHAGKRAMAIPFVHTAAIALYYILNRSSEVISERGRILTSGIASHTVLIGSAFLRVVGRLNAKMICSGFIRGVNVLVKGHGSLLLLTSVLCVIFAVCASRGYRDKRFCIKKAVFGLLMSLSGIIIFFVIEDTRFTLRSVFFFTVGIGVMFDELLSLIPRKVRTGICAVIFSCAAFVFTVSGAGEVSRYNDVSAHDSQIVRNITDDDFANDLMSPDIHAYLLDTVAYYPDTESTEYYENIRAACSGIADLSGCLMHELNTRNINHIVPVENGAEFKTAGDETDFETLLLSDSCRFFALMPNYSVINIYAVPEGSGSFALTAKDGGLYGHIYLRDGAYVFEKDITQ